MICRLPREDSILQSIASQNSLRKEGFSPLRYSFQSIGKVSLFLCSYRCVALTSYQKVTKFSHPLVTEMGSQIGVFRYQWCSCVKRVSHCRQNRVLYIRSISRHDQLQFVSKVAFFAFYFLSYVLGCWWMEIMLITDNSNISLGTSFFGFCSPPPPPKFPVTVAVSIPEGCACVLREL
jgi:hypothetical protein